MKFETTFLRSRVARRIFVLFICCALLPIGVLAILSFSQVEKKLNELGQRRLHYANKAVGMAILERLTFLEDELKIVASQYGTKSSHILPPPPAGFSEHLKERFKSLAIITGKGEMIPLLGHTQNIPKLTPGQKQHIRSGGTLVSSERYPDLTLEIFMTMALDSKNHGRGVLLGRLDPAYLWRTSAESPLLPMTELCLLDQSNHVLFSSFPGPVSFPEQAMLQMSRSALGQFEWVHEKKEYMANYWSIFLQAAFSTPKWTVVMSESKSDVLAPAANFKKIFLLVFLLSLWVVLFLSIVQIRRSLIPLEKLQEGTKRIATQDFNSPVTIKSGDEFEELAASFNAMAGRLGKQFNTITTMSKIDQAILSALKTEKIIDVVLTRIPDVFPCDHISVTLLDYSDRIIARMYIGGGTTDKEKIVEPIELSAKEIEELVSHPESLLIGLGDAAPNYLAPMVRNDIKTFLILPIILKKRLSGFITLGWSLKSAIHNQEDFDRARQLADQMGVALSNASLVRELNELNWGTLEALARTIDAKSHWTGGHSERVTKLGVKIGRVLGLTREELDVLHRGGLLHDIGKLGVPVDILDKDGKLTKEEEKVMREHVRLGTRILEPIAAYADVIPIVLHHHEYFNGEGYPDGLAGKDISLGGRIFSVADSFDALTSDRPYRQALNREHAIEVIKQGCGSQYDPDIVRAFLEVIAQESREGEA
ncbi:MAG: HD domain-containing phosphohydrolase [Syntrophales bacterium]